MIDFSVNKLFNVLFCRLAPACASVKLRCLLSLFTIIFSNSLLMLLHNDIPLFSIFLLSCFSLSIFINIEIFHWRGISSKSDIVLKKVCNVCVRNSSPYLKNSFLTSSGPSCLWYLPSAHETITLILQT